MLGVSPRRSSATGAWRGRGCAASSAGRADSDARTLAAGVKDALRGGAGAAPEERAAFLARDACAGDEELRARGRVAARGRTSRRGLPEHARRAGLASPMRRPSAAPRGSASGSTKRCHAARARAAWARSTWRVDTRLGRKVALKLLPPVLHARRRARAPLRAGGARRLRPQPPEHRHHLRDRRGRDGRHFIATEFVEGETLRERLAARAAGAGRGARDRRAVGRGAWRRRTRRASSTATSSPRT